MKKSAKILSLLLAMTMLFTLIVPSGYAEGSKGDTPKSGHYYMLVNKATGSCLTETDDNTFDPPYDTRRVILDEVNGNDAQIWRLSLQRVEGEKVGSLISTRNGKGLHRTARVDDRLSEANFVVTNTYNSASPEQSWKFIEAGDGYYRIESEDTAVRYPPIQYLTATEFESEQFPGKLDITAAPLDEDNDAQLWRLIEVEGPPIEENDVQPIPGYPLDPITEVELKQPYLYSRIGAGDTQIEGYVGDVIDFIYEEQVQQIDWTMLVDQYRYETDNVANGWQQWKGEFWGKLMRGATWYYKYTQDEELYNALERTVMDLLSTQEENGRISAYPIDGEFVVHDLWCRKYTMLGLEYFYDICKDEEMKEYILSRLCIDADYILTKIGPEEGKQSILTGEIGGLTFSSCLEPFVKLYKMTGYQRYFDFATYIVDSGCWVGGSIFEAAYNNEISPYQYTNAPHGYAMTSCFSGLAEYYTVTGEQKWLTALQNYTARIMEEELTIVGSGGASGAPMNWSPEYWNNTAKEQANPDLVQMQETCTTVAWMQLCERVLSLTEDSTYVDSLEQSLYNGLLGALQGPGAEVTGACAALCWDYFSPLQGTHNNDFGGHIHGVDSCCNASGLTGIAMIPFFQVMNGPEGPVVNLYNPGTMKANIPSGGKVTLDMNTNYPVEGNVEILVTPETEEAFTIKLRIPGWSEEATVLVNGEAVEGVTAGEYLNLTRTWKAGDKIELVMDMKTKVVDCPDGSATEAGEYIALIRGPITLARDARFNDGSVIDGSAILVDENGYADVTIAEDRSFHNHMEFEVKTKDGGSIRMTDYASAGSTWTVESQYATWLVKEEPMELKEGTEYYLYCKADQNLLTAAATEDGNVYRTGYQFGDSLQTWVLEKSGESYYLKNVGTGKYLNADGNANGSNVLVMSEDNGKVLWNIENRSRDEFTIVSSDGMLVSASGNDSNVHLWETGGGSMQVWQFVEKKPPMELKENTKYQITCGDGNLLTAASTEDGNVYRAEKQDGNDLQTWVLEKSGDSYYFKNVGTGKYLTADGNANGSNVLVTAEKNEQALWSTSYKTENSFMICKDDAGIFLSGSGNDSNVHLWEDGNSVLQVWTFEEVGPVVEDNYSVSAPETVQMNESFEVTVTTGSDVSNIRFFNENGMQMGLREVTCTDNGDGTLTWKAKMSIGTAGFGRTITLAVADEEGALTKTDANFTIDVLMPEPVVLEASIEEKTVVNAPVTLTVVTDKTVQGISVTNENGMGMGILSSSYEDNEEGRTWTVTIKIGSVGTRTFNVYGRNKMGDLSEAVTTNAVTVSYY